MQTSLLSSAWREQEASGAQILEERGLLRGAAVGLSGSLKTLNWMATLQGQAGVRDYEGRTNQGAALFTRSDIDAASLSLKLWVPAASAWQLGAAIEPSRTLRRLRDTDSAMGYREAWRWTLVEASLRWMPYRAAGWSLEAAGGMAVRPTVHVTLPNFDPATLHPGIGRSLRFEALYRAAFGDAAVASADPGWRWVTGLRWERWVFGASAAEPLTRQGVWRGGVSQPRTVIQAGRWFSGVEKDWP